VFEKHATITPSGFFNIMADIFDSSADSATSTEESVKKSSEKLQELAKHYFTLADRDNSGSLDWNEFLEVYAAIVKSL